MKIRDGGWSIYGYWLEFDGGTCAIHPRVYFPTALDALEFLGNLAGRGTDMEGA